MFTIKITTILHPLVGEANKSISSSDTTGECVHLSSSWSGSIITNRNSDNGIWERETSKQKYHWKQYSHSTGRIIVPSPRLLPVVSELNPTDRAPALQVNEVLSSVLSGDNVRVLVSDGWEPDKGEIVIRPSVLFDNWVSPLSQVTETVTGVSTAESIEMLQFSLRGVVMPANNVPEGARMVTVGVETAWGKETYSFV